MSIVEEIYRKNFQITDLELAEEIVKHSELTILDLWLLPQYPFDQWRRKYNYPNLLKNIKENQNDFQTWMTEQEITDEYLLSGYFSDFIENKPLSKDKKLHLIRVSYKGKITLQSWHKYNGETSIEGDGEPVLYEFIKEYISYYDWKLLKGERFNFINTFHRYDPNTEDESVYLNHNIKLLKMGGIEPPTNSVGILLRGKKLEFINASGLDLKGTICFGSMGNLSFEHCAVDNLKCSELDMPLLDFQNCSIRNLQIRNSYVRQWLFVSCNTTGNIIDSKLEYIRIYGGQFNPAFTNSDIGEIEVQHEGVVYDYDFDKTYRSLAKCARESGKNELYRKLKIKEYDFIRSKSKNLEKVLKTIDKIYWQYGQNPKRLIYITIITIILFGFLYSFFPENFKNREFIEKPYWQILYNTQYYSVVTFTTLGYGDIIPTGIVKSIAAIEALFGAITMGFLVAGLARTE
jgi:Ion channel